MSLELQYIQGLPPPLAFHPASKNKPQRERGREATRRPRRGQIRRKGPAPAHSDEPRRSELQRCSSNRHREVHWELECLRDQCQPPSSLGTHLTTTRGQTGPLYSVPMNRRQGWKGPGKSWARGQREANTGNFVDEEPPKGGSGRVQKLLHEAAAPLFDFGHGRSAPWRTAKQRSPSALI